MSKEPFFDTYLSSVVDAYRKWWCLYTLTDLTGRESQPVERDSPAFFDFGLMVQTVEPPKAEQERELVQDREKKEKIERLPVLEGICKYAADHVLLAGRPGSGKSTALARLLLQEAEIAIKDKQAKIPVLVELRYLPSEANESSVIKYIRDFGFRKHDQGLNLDDKTIENLDMNTELVSLQLPTSLYEKLQTIAIALRRNLPTQTKTNLKLHETEIKTESVGNSQNLCADLPNVLG
jgi:DNA polymerase III delta prime subunit